MCWMKYQKSKPKIKIAKENIIVFKLVNRMRSLYYQDKRRKYEINKIYWAREYDNNGTMRKIKKLKIFNENGFWKVNAGIHSYDERSISECNLKCIIPKGTKYLLNNYGEYVSEKIKPIKKIKKLT